MQIVKIERYLVKVNETLSFEVTRHELQKLYNELRKLLESDVPRYSIADALVNKIWSQGEY